VIATRENTAKIADKPFNLDWTAEISPKVPTFGPGEYNRAMRTAVAAAFGLAALTTITAGAVPVPLSAAQGRAVRREAAVPFKVGETLSYDVSWSSFFKAGTAIITVREKKASFDSTAYYIVADGRPLPLIARLYPLYYKMDTLLDSFTLLSQRTAVYQEEGSQRRTMTTRFDRDARRVFFERQADSTVRSNFSVVPLTQDGLAALYALRATPLQTGAKFVMPITDDGAVYSVGVAVGAREHITVPFGDFEAWVLTMGVSDAQQHPVGNNIGVWISTDTRHLPLKLQADLPVGNFVLALREAL
jgi:hypothetical protein